MTAQDTATIEAKATAREAEARMNALTDYCTAFHTWADFKRSLDTGYVPTIHQGYVRGERRNRAKDAMYEANRLLTTALRLLGYKVFDGTNTK